MVQTMKRILRWLFNTITLFALCLANTHADQSAVHRPLTQAMGAGKSETAKPAGVSAGAVAPLSRHLIYLRVRPKPVQPALRVRLDGNAGLGLLVTDPEGRRSGVALGSHKILRAIPHSQVRRVLGNSGPLKTAQTVLITIAPAQSTTYALAIAGRRAGQYTLVVNGVSPSLHALTEPFSDQRIPADTVVHYRVRLKNIPAMYPWSPMTAYTAPPPANEFVSQTGQSVIMPVDPVLLAAAAAIDRAPCGYFYRRLKEVFHQRITRRQGRLTWYPNGSRFSGCQVVLHIGNDTPAGGPKLPDFYLPEGSYLYRLGWRQNLTWGADGSYSSVRGFADRSWLCVAVTQWPQAMIKKHGRSVPSGALRLTVQCRKNGPRAK